jgi:hypothetical protein
MILGSLLSFLALGGIANSYVPQLRANLLLAVN